MTNRLMAFITVFLIIIGFAGLIYGLVEIANWIRSFHSNTISTIAVIIWIAIVLGIVAAASQED